MRAAFSKLSTLHFYEGDRLSDICPSCTCPIQVHTSKGVPNFRLIFEDRSQLGGIFFVVNECTNEIAVILYNEHEEVEVGGKTYYVQKFTGNLNLPVGTYSISMTVFGDTQRFFKSDTFQVCNIPPKYVLRWDDDCGNKYGEYQNELYIEDIEPNKIRYEELSEVKTNGYGQKETKVISVTPIYSFNIVGNDALAESLGYIRLYDNVTLHNLISGEVINLNNVQIQADSEDCLYPITILYDQGTEVKEDCCEVSDPFIDSCEVIDPPLECDGYAVSISESNGTLTFTETSPPNADRTIVWTINNNYAGSGETITRGAYGQYAVQVIRGNCTAKDSYTYTDPCSNLTLQVSVSGATIAGAANGDTNIVITVKNAQGTVIATGLPFTVPESEGDGNYTVVAKGDNCEKQKAVYVKVTPPIPCDHDLALTYVNGVLRGTTSRCSGTVSTEFIQYEDENGVVTTVSTDNEHTPTATGMYWYNAKCGECLKRIYKLIIFKEEEKDECVKLCPDTKIKVVVCDADSGEDTKVMLPR